MGDGGASRLLAQRSTVNLNLSVPSVNHRTPRATVTLKRRAGLAAPLFEIDRCEPVRVLLSARATASEIIM